VARFVGTLRGARGSVQRHANHGMIAAVAGKELSGQLEIYTENDGEKDYEEILFSTGEISVHVFRDDDGTATIHLMDQQGNVLATAHDG
jgi:hypothetical protein